MATEPQRNDLDWCLTYRVAFFALKEGAYVHLAIPQNNGYIQTVSENLSCTGLEVRGLRVNSLLGKELELVATDGPAQCELIIRIYIRLKRNRNNRGMPYGDLLSVERQGGDLPLSLGAYQLACQLLERGIAEMPRVIKAMKAKGVWVTYHVEPLFLQNCSFRQERGLLSTLIDLDRLPPEARQVVLLILLLPIGALVVVFFRNIVGLETFGTFTPALLALSLAHTTNWGAGLAVFVAVLSVGVLGRVVLEWFSLPVFPRLGAVLTFVVLGTAMTISALNRFGLEYSSAVLLPMVVMTMMVERFHITAEEDGMKYAIKMLANTLFVGACCVLLFRWDGVNHFLVAFPEVHLFTAAALVLMGLYRGYRLSELWRFSQVVKHWVGEESEKKCGF